MFDRFRILPQLWRTGRLAIRLVRDSRVPLAAKLIVVATVAYIISPIDIVPDWLPIAGQADDIMVLLAGLNFFLKACPRWLVQEHEDSIDGRRQDDSSRREAGRAAGSAPYADPIDARYQRVR